jgi:hypothetical protein
VPGIGAANIASLPARVAASTLIGGAEGATIAAGTDQDVAQATGVGAAIAGGVELLLPRVGRLGGQLFRRITGRAPTTSLVGRDGVPTQEFTDALDRAGLTFDDVVNESQFASPTDLGDAAVQSRRAFLEDNGLIPSRAQVTGEATDFQTQQELAKRSGKVRRLLEGQESVLFTKFENQITSTGGSANRSNSPAFDFIADRAIDLDAAIGDAYTAARNVAGDNKVIKSTNLIEQLKKIAGSDSATGGLASATRDFLRGKGILTGKALKSDARIDPATAEELRADMNSLFDSLTPFGRGKLRDLKNALDDDVARDVGEDIFEGARAMKAKFESDLKRVKVNKFDKRKKELVKDILENKINPERFLDEAVLSRTVRSTDLEQLKRYMLLDDNPEGLQAWNDLRAEAMNRIRDSAFNVVGGDPALSRAALEKSLDKFGRDKLRVLFSGEERKFLNDMLKISTIREPKRGTQQGLGPSAQAIRVLSKGVEKIPLIGQAFEGLSESLAQQAGVTLPAPITSRALRVTQPGIAAGVISATQQEQQ